MGRKGAGPNRLAQNGRQLVIGLAEGVAGGAVTEESMRAGGAVVAGKAGGPAAPAWCRRSAGEARIVRACALAWHGWGHAGSSGAAALPIPQIMEGALSLIGLAFAALLVVAVGVAWWEQTGSEGRAAAASEPQPVLSVDLHLDHLAELPDPETPPAGDQDRRDAVLGHAMARMVQPPPSPNAWIETRPMVAPGPRAEPVPSSWG
jgi:hypothetical protein